MKEMSPDRSENRRVDTKRCQNCRSHVTTAFARVFGDNQGRVFRCRSCAERSDLFEGDSAVPPSQR